jgi:hypothetical protein
MLGLPLDSKSTERRVWEQWKRYARVGTPDHEKWDSSGRAVGTLADQMAQERSKSSKASSPRRGFFNFQ